jgi:hypothetical protein
MTNLKMVKTWPDSRYLERDQHIPMSTITAQRFPNDIGEVLYRSEISLFLETILKRLSLKQKGDMGGALPLPCHLKR